MPDLRDMELLAALARNRHFARAATECGISQPAFSARIRNMELDLGAAIVQRGNRFVGFTP
ncbi:MAG: LysR family transcriptional regulator, partial [Pseudomonadota bacterium]